MKLFSKDVKELLSKDEAEIFTILEEQCDEEVKMIDDILKRIKEKEQELYCEINKKLYTLKAVCDDEIRLKARKKLILKEHQEHYVDIEPQGYGYRYFDITKGGIDSIKDTLSHTVEEFNN